MEIFAFGGTNPHSEVAFVIAGVHGSELSGIEVARWLVAKLTDQAEKGIKPYYHTIVIPELYPDSAKLARMKNRNPKGWLQDLQTKDPVLSEKAQYNANNVNWDIGREVIQKVNGVLYTVYPNRQFPPPGQPLSFLEQHKGPTDASGRQAVKATHEDQHNSKNEKSINAPILPETRQLLTFIELFKPARIASIHGKHLPRIKRKGIDAPGIFVDPRYDYDPKVCGIDPVDQTLDTFGTNLCKFDIIKDPAFPLVGFFQLLNELNTNPPLNLQQTVAIKAARDAYKSYTHPKKGEATDDKAKEKKLNDIETKQREAFRLLNMDYDKDYLQKKTTVCARNSAGQADDQLALTIATAINSQNKNLAPGNWFSEKQQVVHYSASTPPASGGYSLGDWGPVTVGKSRPGAPVITVEVFEDNESRAFDGQTLKGSGFDQKRAQELQIYADALMAKFLNL